MATSATNTPMEHQLNSNQNINNINNNGKKSVIKSPRFSEQLIPDYDLHLGRKQTESFGNQKKQGNNTVPINQIRELKETISTNSTLKNAKTLNIGDFQIGK